MESRHLELLADFNLYRSRTFHTQQLRVAGPLRDIGPKKGLPPLQIMDAWCQAQGLDSRRWLYHLFRKRNWLFSPRLDQLVPSKRHFKKALADYARVTDTPAFEAVLSRGLEASRRAAGTDCNPNRDLIAMAEERKRIYLGEARPDKCMYNMLSETYGYHPRSTPCARCPVTYQCAAQLQATVAFDIQALRRGEMTLQQAQVIAARAQHGG